MSPWETIGIAILGSTALSSLIQFFVTRHDKKVEAKLDIKGKLTVLEKDVLRSQLLLLILLKPAEQQEILTVGEHYFKDLHGNWYMTSIFNKWLIESDIAEPEWFENKEK